MEHVLAHRAEEEAEDLALVGGGIGNGEGEVEGERSWSERGNADAEAEARRHAEIVGADCDIALDGSEIAEEGSAEHLVGREREEVFERIQELELATDADAGIERGGAAELEAAERGEAAGEIVFKERRLRAAEAKLGGKRDGMAASAVGTLPGQEVLSEVD